jgi:hypothetical protein
MKVTIAFAVLLTLSPMAFAADNCGNNASCSVGGSGQSGGGDHIEESLFRTDVTFSGGHGNEGSGGHEVIIDRSTGEITVISGGGGAGGSGGHCTGPLC